jgi:Protein of unknown function (DUF3606)
MLATILSPMTSAELDMSDDKSNRGNPDRDRISLDQDYEVNAWTKSLGVTKEKLAAAVHAVGNSAEKVKAYLSRRSR